MLTAIVSALAAILVAIIGSVGAVYLTKQKEREAAWRAKKLAYYEEFIGARSGIVGGFDHPAEAEIRFATIVNNLNLIGSWGVIKALREYCDEITNSNLHKSNERHDVLWSRLVWEMTDDLGEPPTKSPKDFYAISWGYGIRKDQNK